MNNWLDLSYVVVYANFTLTLLYETKYNYLFHFIPFSYLIKSLLITTSLQLSPALDHTTSSSCQHSFSNLSIFSFQTCSLPVLACHAHPEHTALSSIAFQLLTQWIITFNAFHVSYISVFLYSTGLCE